MTSDLQQLVSEAMELTGAPPPVLLEENSPTLGSSALRDGDDSSPYIIGLIGGKDVGKSSLVNALVGQEITPRTSHGPGTEIVIAYVHESQAPTLRKLLEQEVPGRYRLVIHTLPHLLRQVLLDLPDIDSHYADHVEITRRMLRHMLYPIWIQSIEKYADQQPLRLLAKVAAGNPPENFIFCLNKMDQVVAREGPAVVQELSEDYAWRLGPAVGLQSPPRVWRISAAQPEQYDLPALRGLLAQQKPLEDVHQSKQLAFRQQGISVLKWLEGQDLRGRAQRLGRLEEEAEELVAERIGTPLLEETVPGIIDDPSYRMAMIDECMRRRVSRWPIVNIVHVLLSSAASVLRRRLSLDQQYAMQGAAALADLHLRPGGQPLATLVQSTFAQLRQSQPAIAALYRQNRLWDDRPAEMAAGDLRKIIAGTIDLQRTEIQSRIAGGRGILGAPLRWLLTIGAVLWFPFAQPILEAWLRNDRSFGTGLGLLLVQLFGVNYLLRNIGFLVVYFVILWLVLRWDTQRRVHRLLGRVKRADGPESSLDLAAQSLEWMDSLVEPLRVSRQRLDALVQRMEQLRQSLGIQGSEAPMGTARRRTA